MVVNFLYTNYTLTIHRGYTELWFLVLFSAFFRYLWYINGRKEKDMGNNIVGTVSMNGTDKPYVKKKISNEFKSKFKRTRKNTK